MLSKKQGRRALPQHLRTLVGMRVRELREREQMTQEIFGAMFEVSAQTVTAWEHGRRLPELDRIIDMADWFGVTTDWLLSR